MGWYIIYSKNSNTVILDNNDYDLITSIKDNNGNKMLYYMNNNSILEYEYGTGKYANLLNNVKKSYAVKFGKNNDCLDNEAIIAIKNDNSISALYLDNSICSKNKNIEVINNIANINDANNVNYKNVCNNDDCYNEVIITNIDGDTTIITEALIEGFNK